MKYYERTITKREPINRFGKLGFVPYTEYVKTNEIEKYNKGKKIHYKETETAREYLYHLKRDCIYCEKGGK